MAGCKIIAGITLPDCADKFFEPGLKKQDIYFANRDEVTVGFTGEVVTLFTFDTIYSGFLSVDVHKDTSSWGEELVTATNAGSHYTQTFIARTINKSQATITSIENMVDTDLLIVVHEKSGRFIVLGISGGVTMSEDVSGSGAAPGDDTGTLFTVSGTNGGKAPTFFVTDEAVTRAQIEAQVIADA